MRVIRVPIRKGSELQRSKANKAKIRDNPLNLRYPRSNWQHK